MQKKYRRMLIMLVYILVVSSTIAYSALTSTLQLNAEAKLRTISDIRVTGISLSSANGGTLQYESSYDVNTITSGFVLPTTDSSITYKVTVTNNGTIDQTIYDILTQSSNNSGLYYEISGYNVRDVIGFKSVIEFYITYKTTTPSNDVINVVNKFNFKKVYHVTFEAKGGTSITDGIKYEGVDLDLSTFTSTKQGYILSGWTDEQDGTTVKYQTNGTYTLDRDLILYAVWEPNPNTSYSVNHYVHDLGTNTYTLDSTDNLTGTTDSTLTLASLKKTIPGFTYVDGYLTGGTTKPESGAVTTTTILADGSRVINLYYRRNYLYVQYHVNGGQLAEQHGSSATVINDLIASNNETTFLRGVYGSKVGGVNTSTYETSKGLHNYNSPAAINIEKNGYIGKSKQQWNTSSDGTGTSYNQDVATYNADGFAGADLSTGDQVVTLYVNWVPVDYEIQYDLQGGTLSTANPSTYNIETGTITLNNPTLTGYTFTGWTGSNGNTPETTVTIPTGSTGDKAYIANWQANTYNVTFDTDGGTIGANELFSFDGSTHTIDGTVVGATWGDDYLEFAGNDSSYVNLGEINSDYMTLQATFSVDEMPTETEVIMGNIESGGSAIFIAKSPTTNNMNIAGYSFISGSYRRIDSEIVPEVGKKYNVLLSYDGETERLYIDNVLIDEIKISGVITPPASNTVMALGGNPSGSAVNMAYFKGKIYNASIYSNPKKQVTYDSPYGTLPTPTREGYIFKGWNGKNYINPSLMKVGSRIQVDNNGKISATNKTTDSRAWNSSNSDIKLTLPAGTYTLSMIFDKTTSHQYAQYHIYRGTTDIYTLMLNGKTVDTKTFTLSEETEVGIEMKLYEAEIYLQIEEGTTATTYEPYYVTNTVNVTQAKDHTLKAIWEKKEATFLRGSEFNAKIKQLAGNENATYQTSDTNITSIVRSNSLDIMPVDENVISTSDSNTPIYAWFNNGTLYYYTDAVNLYMNVNANYMFYKLRNVNSIDLDDINTTKTTSMYALFHSCLNLSNLDLSDFNTENVQQTQGMFYNCSSLTSIDLSSFDMSKVTNTSNMLDSMTLLKSLKTPDTYPTDSSVKITLPKTLIDASGNEYTELDNTSPTETMLYTPATFLPGQEFNAKVKQLAGNQNATSETVDTNITSIVRANALPNGFAPIPDNVVSTSDSYYPIYAWYDNGTIYYYTEYSNPYMNSTASHMFRQLSNVTRIDLNTINTSRATTMWAMFLSCINLQSIDLSNFDTSNVTTMQSMFQGCSSLSSINLSSFNTQKVNTALQMFLGCNSLETITFGDNFNTSNITTMYRMFYNVSKLSTLDLSGFDMSSATDTTDMLTGMTSLESLKTPNTYPSEAVIQMSRTLYDPSGNGWSVLDSSAPTETWLHKMVCKRATTLHTETCSQTDSSLYCSGAGYTVGGSKNTSTITYGSLGTNDSTLNGGDAFTCDVNGDGTFNEATERFYYVGDYYNTTTKEFETDTGVLVYYNNVSAGAPDNTTGYSYDSSGSNLQGPQTAILQLPTISQWSNVNLKRNERQITNYGNYNTSGGQQLSSNFSYSGYAARLLTQQEINNSVGKSITAYGGNTAGLDKIAPYYFENTRYSNNNSNENSWWLENVTVTATTHGIRIMTATTTQYGNGIYSIGVTNTIGVRPAIEVNKNFLNKKVNAYLITYDTNGGSENTTQTVNVGDSLGSLPVPTREGYTFNGWYTEASGGTQITTATVPTATTTYYAHWTPINYNITYDLDGGTVATSNPSTYNADSNSITLNNPTKTGYTFAGWSGGKNLFNMSEWLDLCTSASAGTINKGNNSITLTATTNNHGAYTITYYVTRATYGDLNSYKLNVKPNTTYTLSWKTDSDKPGRVYVFVNDKDNNDGDNNMFGSNSTSHKLTFTTPSDAEFIRMRVDVNNTGDSITYSDFQLEEGTTATSYEPYVSNETTLTIPSGSVGNRKYKANWTANTYTVTADANGGSIPSTSGWTGNTATKSVTYDSQYGTLPTPTRNGYTFKGWNGKNLFDSSKGENGYILDTGDISNTQVNYLSDYIEVDSSKTYTLSGNVVFYNIGIAYYDSNKEFLSRRNNFNEQSASFTPQASGYIRFWISLDNSTALNSELISSTYKVQLEEGTTATPYEPYYVTSSTNVTQDKNHTLKAIWDMDTYEIQYDLQGGTLANSNPVTYNVETNTFTLNNPTLTGQTFIGWTGSNGNTPEVNVTIPVGSYGDKAYVANFSPIYEPETRIRSLNTIGTTIADDDPDSNLRFIGSNPSNYVSFNGQKWRIIGVFDGKLKIIGDSIGNYSWDTSRNTVNNGYGVNQWGVSGTYTGADLMKLLNPGYSTNTDLKCNTTVTVTDGVANCGDNTDSNYTTGLVNNSLYWNASSGYCYNYGNYKTTSCDFTTTGLQSDTTRNMIDNATWYLGSVNASQNIWAANTFTASFAYNFERGNLNGKQCSSGTYCTDTVDRTTTWQGKVGLLYPSDYIYATSGGSTYNRNTCLTVHAGYVSDNSVSNWNNTYTDCKNNDWLLNTSMWTWSLSPRANSSNSGVVFTVYSAGIVYNNNALYAGSVRPVVYLKSSIKLTSGDGSYNSPFNLIDTE